ncbi:MAG: branched-chain amino acid aminotransferase [Chloroflexi bacterium]|jgi:branched-chain amino acid aminotransferase|nr:MAG: branched-chain amino acid aminotransferase [Chloroflexota bacterium]|tara:strand:+ start:1116 stop:2033 length:918 start_codon:yes stop_codon:yes gene_type:complete
MNSPIAYLNNEFMELKDAKINIVTHAFNYGTGVFEGIRGNWNDQSEQLYIFKLEEHVERIFNSAKIMRLDPQITKDQMCQILIELVKKNNYREDIYIRPIIYKSSEIVGLRMHDLDDDFLAYIVPFGNYLDPNAGIHCGVSSIRRIDDSMVPVRAKVTGIYVNNSMAKTEAVLNGYDEAIMLNMDGHISEGTGENIVIIKNNTIISPTAADNILEGLTLEAVLEIVKNHLQINIERRSIDRSELYIADEVFMTGTAAHVTPVVSIDKINIGNGKPGLLSKKIQEIYFSIIRGENDQYSKWLKKIY